MSSVHPGPAFALALAGAFLAAIVLGPQVPMCLGPIGVTAIQCDAALGRTPTAGPALPVIVSIFGAAALLVVGPFRDRRAAAVGAALGAMIGGGGYLRLRPTEMHGPISNGAVISIALPVDPPALVAAVLAGAVGGIVVAVVLARAGRRAPSPVGR
jgi:hypothetical protein